MNPASTAIYAHAQHFEATDESIRKTHSLTTHHTNCFKFSLCVQQQSCLSVAPTSTIPVFCFIVRTLAPNQTSKPLRGDHFLVFCLYCCQRLSTFLASCLFILSNLFRHYFLWRSIQMTYPALYQFTSDTVLIIFCNSFLLTLIGNVSVTLTKRLVSVFCYLFMLCQLSQCQQRRPYCLLYLAAIFCAQKVFLYILVSCNLKLMSQCSHLLGDI